MLASSHPCLTVRYPRIAQAFTKQGISGWTMATGWRGPTCLSDDASIIVREAVIGLHPSTVIRKQVARALGDAQDLARIIGAIEDLTVVILHHRRAWVPLPRAGQRRGEDGGLLTTSGGRPGPRNSPGEPTSPKP